ncbi:ATP-binding protein [Priestia megaterium]|uniref:ATP-binding protein n=1 Tax=Priestia megaterium TaxID=1404 RepID=UPI0035A9ABC1
MKEYISEIVSILHDNIDFTDKSKAYLFRLDNFVHPRIYLEVCKHFRETSSRQGISFHAKLSKEQYAIFHKHEELLLALKELEQEGFVEQEAQMTTWRNSVADQKGILFLMGTESVQDKGGLADFYKLSPEVIDQQVGKKYTNWFVKLIDVEDQFERTAVNHFLEHLFRLVPKDLYKLSCIIDRLEKEMLFGVEEVLESMGRNLVTDWGLPCIHGFDSRIMSQLGKGKKFDLLDKANKFKNRAEFKDGLTKARFNKLLKKIEDFKTSKKREQFNESIEQSKKIFGSVEKFEQALIDYFKGKNLEVLRPQLFQLDFNFINAIVNFKTTKEDPKVIKDTVVKVYGAPIEAFAKIIFNSLSILRKMSDDNDKPKLQITVHEAVLSNYVEDNEYDLYNAWAKICFTTGGLIEYLQEELEDDIEISFKGDKDPFQISNSEALSIKPTRGTQTLSNILLSVEVEGIEKPIEYKWVFNFNDSWINIFDINLLDSLIEKSQSSLRFLPIFHSDSLGNLLSSIDSDIFFHQLNGANQEFVNVFELLPRELQEGNVASKLYQLSKPFREFLNDLKNKGFYNTISARKSNSGTQFIEKYIAIIDSLIKNSATINTIERKYVHLVTNLFLIVSSKEKARDEYLKGAIVPPLHPAMLEKMVEQQAFYRKGFHTLLDEALNDKNNKRYEKVIENIVRQSTIISGLDTIISDVSSNRLTKEVFGYYALYGEILEENSLESMTLLDNDLVFDEDFNTKEMLKNSFMSRLIEGKLTEYVQTFPAQSDSIKIAFINFEHLQPVVAGVHAFIETLRETTHTISIKLQIISPSHLQEGRTYVNFWLDNFFSEEDNVKIETYYRNINLENGNYLVLEDVLLNHDMIFINDVMSTGRIAYRHTGETNIAPSETRFPMVFHPMPVYEADSVRRVSISQRQFKASFIHSQLTHWIESPDSKDGVYRVEKELFMSDQMKKVLEILHCKARWVVALDTALDKSFFNRDEVISFSTGEGPYGELNMTISASRKVKEDVINRLTKRLKDLFPSWDQSKLNACAQYCIEESKDLDGIKVLKALNPYDYEAHSFLSYILSVNSLGINSHDEDVLLKAYIPMDSYMHWFIDTPNRPDYLLIEIRRDNISREFIEIDATMVECKMGKESNAHIEKGLTQLTNSINYLSVIFNGSSTSYNRRYWFAQLYRALVFAPNFVSNIQEEQSDFNQGLLNILDGNFKINWSAKLLTYWLDYNQEEISKETIELDGTNIICSHEAFGQLYIQKALLPQELEEDIEYENIGNKLLSFANNQIDFESLVQENGHELMDGMEEEARDEREQPTRPIIITPYSVNTNQDVERNFNSVTKDDRNIDEGEIPSDELRFSKDNLEDVDRTKKSYVDNDHQQDDTVAEEKDLEKELIPLERVRILLGKDVRTKQNIYWEYGHPQLENRHILISGKSGVGKTYFIQCMLYELTTQNIPNIIFDYTDGFKNNKLEPEFKNGLEGKIEQFYVYQNSFPINPFKRNQKQLDEDIYVPETDTDVAERLKGVFQSIYKLGPQQASAIYRATMSGLKKYGQAMNLEYLRAELIADGSNYAQTALFKLEPLIDRSPFDIQGQYNWDEHFSRESKVFVVQLLGFTREVQLIITEFILWDLWNYKLSHGDKAKPFAAIIDEAQNLDHSESSPSAKILTEGRKFGWSGWYATQFMQGQLGKDEIQRLQNASQKIYFAPPEEEITSIASYLDTDSYKRKEWAKKLSSLRKGQCVVWGPMLRPDGNLEKMGPRIIDVIPFSERIKNNGL